MQLRHFSAKFNYTIISTSSNIYSFMNLTLIFENLKKKQNLLLFKNKNLVYKYSLSHKQSSSKMFARAFVASELFQLKSSVNLIVIKMEKHS